MLKDSKIRLKEKEFFIWFRVSWHEWDIVFRGTNDAGPLIQTPIMITYIMLSIDYVEKIASPETH